MLHPPSRRGWAHSAPSTTPRLLARLWWGLFADFPLRRQPANHDTADLVVSCLPYVRLFDSSLAQLPSLAVGCLSREPRARPGLPSIGPLLLSASPERSVRGEISSHARPLVTPNPHPPAVHSTGISRAWDRLHLVYTVISVHAALAWPGSPCAWPPTHSRHITTKPITYSMYLPAATNLTASTACDLQQHLEEPPGSI